MKVLVATPTFFPIVGGAELLIRDVGNLWSEEHDVRLVTGVLPQSSEPYWVGSSGDEESCRFEIARFDDKWSFMRSRGHRITHGLLPPMSLSALAAINREIRRSRPDVLVTFFAVPYGLPSILLKFFRRIPVVLVLCGNDLPGPRTRNVPFWASYLRWATKAADKVVYVSRFCFTALERRGFDPEHDIILYGGVDERSLRSTPEAVRVLRRRLGLGEGDVMLFSLQRLAPEKRVDVLIRAFALLPDLGRRVVLVIGGQGTEMERLERLAYELGVSDRVHFPGHLNAEKADYFAAADVFVFHSIFETFGQVVAEAMAAGKPVLSVRAGAIPEVVAADVTGLLVQPNDPVEMALQMERLICDEALRLSLGEAGRRRVRACFSWPDMVDLWRSVLATPESSPAFLSAPADVAYSVEPSDRSAVRPGG